MFTNGTISCHFHLPSKWKLSLTKVAEEFAVDRLYVEAPGRASDDIMFAIIDDGFARRLSKI